MGRKQERMNNLAPFEARPKYEYRTSYWRHDIEGSENTQAEDKQAQIKNIALEMMKEGKFENWCTEVMGFMKPWMWGLTDRLSIVQEIYSLGGAFISLVKKMRLGLRI